MKRSLSLLLALFLIFPLASCSAKKPAVDDGISGEWADDDENFAILDETCETFEYPWVQKPLSLSMLAEIPIADASMPMEDLRQICVDFFALQVSFSWTPKEAANYVVDSQNHKVSYELGSLYGGIPYVNLGSGNLYRISDYCDPETGILDVSLLETNEKIFGNACSGSAATAWGRVINSASLSYTSGFTPKAGFLPLGNYVTNYEIDTFGTNEEKIDVKDVLAQNTKETMFESYALLQPADGVVSGGHVRMAKEAAVVIRNEDGSINGEESFCIFIEQGCYCDSSEHTREQEDGALYQIQGNDHLKVTFEELYKSYIPFTFAEFQGTNPVEKLQFEVNAEGETITVSQFLNTKISANYIISDLYLTLENEGGETVFSRAFRQPKHYLKTCNFSSLCPTSVLSQYAASENHTVTVSAQFLTGERTVVYSGKLCP